MKDMSRAISDNFYSEDALRSFLGQCQNKYQTPAARQFLQRLISNQRKICLTFTRQIFNANAKSTHRGEGINATLKGGSGATLKKTIKKFNLHQFAEHFDATTDLKLEESLKLLVQRFFTELGSKTIQHDCKVSLLIRTHY
jgi:hypothetical protein